MAILVKNLSKAFGEKQVLERFSYSFPDRACTALMGPSGCGKTTLFRILLGLERADSGSITGLSGKPLSVVFQEDRLFPGLTALQNAEVLGTGGREWLVRLGLEKELTTLPENLSGGMRRRVALARALCRDGDIFLLDEPFQGLDEERKQEVMELLRTLKKTKTILLITHDPEEAAFLGDALVRVERG